jgi:hypothetical protein
MKTSDDYWEEEAAKLQAENEKLRDDNERLKAGIRKAIETCYRREAFNGPNPHVTEISLMLHGLLLKGGDDD